MDDTGLRIDTTSSDGVEGTVTITHVATGLQTSEWWSRGFRLAFHTQYEARRHAQDRLNDMLARRTLLRSSSSSEVM